MSPDEITQHFYAKIPLSRQLGIQVISATRSKAVLSAPLAPNINHVSTVFGGSLYAVAALSCYALFQVLAQESGELSDQLVIQEGHIRYLAPVTSDFTVEATLASPGDDKAFLEAVRRLGKGRLSLVASVLCQGQVCANFSGTYVFKK